MTKAVLLAGPLGVNQIGSLCRALAAELQDGRLDLSLCRTEERSEAANLWRQEYWKFKQWVDP